MANIVNTAISLQTKTLTLHQKALGSVANVREAGKENMQRKIKFRAFHRPTKIMQHFNNFWICDEYSSICWAINEDECLPNAYGQNPQTKDIGKREDNFIVMQYTGLKDKNGKEIYEGDIVKSDIYPSSNKVVEIEDALSCTPFMYYMQSTDFEIIGNIYESPELLKE